MTSVEDLAGEKAGGQSVRSGVISHLLSSGKLSLSALERAERVARESGDKLEGILTRLGLVAEAELAETTASVCSLPIISRGDGPDEPLLEEILSRKFLIGTKTIPLALDDDGLLLGMVDPLDDEAVEAIRFACALPVRRGILLPADFEALYDRLYGEGKSEVRQITDHVGGEVGEDGVDDFDRLRDSASEAPVIRLVNLLITRAVEARASDIHIEPMDGELRIRYRVDGVLREIEAPPQRLGTAIISRIKIMAKLNIAERRLAQDGRIRLAVRGKDIDFRVSTTPTIYGESVVLRILDRSGLHLNFDALGLSSRIQESLHEILQQPHGILLVTGPTGSGKTTTLYSALLELNTPDRKILTIEDPVEYQLAGINQVQVKPQIGLTFAGALRSFLRHDPDIMMVGEIRDLETAQIAIQSALTGHLILSTLHTNDAASAVTRLLDMGVEDYLLTSTVTGIVGQRLVRTLCQDCREAYEAMPDLIRRLRVGGAPLADIATKFYRANGCAACKGTGYRGRSSIAEVLIMSDRIRQLVLSRAESGEIRRAAMSEGMVTLFSDGIDKALAGITSVEEIFRVIREV